MKTKFFIPKLRRVQGLRLGIYFHITQMVIRHRDVGGVFHWYVDYCGGLIAVYRTKGDALIITCISYCFQDCVY